MVKLRVDEILTEQGKTRYWLAKNLQMHYVSFKKMVEGNTDSIRFSTLDNLSKILQVPVGELFTQTDEKS